MSHDVEAKPNAPRGVINLDIQSWAYSLDLVAFEDTEANWTWRLNFAKRLIDAANSEIWQ